MYVWIIAECWRCLLWFQPHFAAEDQGWESEAVGLRSQPDVESSGTEGTTLSCPDSLIWPLQVGSALWPLIESGKGRGRMRGRVGICEIAFLNCLWKVGWKGNGASQIERANVLTMEQQRWTEWLKQFRLLFLFIPSSKRFRWEVCLFPSQALGRGNFREDIFEPAPAWGEFHWLRLYPHNVVC